MKEIDHGVVDSAMLAAYCDGQLGEREAARVEQALLERPELRAELTQIAADRRLLIDALSASEADEAPDPAIAALADRLDRQLKIQSARRMGLRGGAVVAGLVIIGIAGWVGHAAVTGTPMFARRFVDPDEMAARVPGFVADAAGAHAIFADDTVHPVEFEAADEAVMRGWFETHLGEGAVIPELDALGFGLVGGRLLADADGAMAQLVYENGKGDRVSLVFGPRPVPGGTDLKLVHVGKRYASYWREGNFAWAVVEDSPGADISAVATHVAELISATQP